MKYCESFEREYDYMVQGNGETYRCIMCKGEPCRNKQCLEYGRCESCINKDTSFCPKEG